MTPPRCPRLNGGCPPLKACAVSRRGEVCVTKSGRSWYLEDFVSAYVKGFISGETTSRYYSDVHARAGILTRGHTRVAGTKSVAEDELLPKTTTVASMSARARPWSSHATAASSAGRSSDPAHPRPRTPGRSPLVHRDALAPDSPRARARRQGVTARAREGASCTPAHAPPSSRVVVLPRVVDVVRDVRGPDLVVQKVQHGAVRPVDGHERALHQRCSRPPSEGGTSTSVCCSHVYSTKVATHRFPGTDRRTAPSTVHRWPAPPRQPSNQRATATRRRRSATPSRPYFPGNSACVPAARGVGGTKWFVAPRGARRPAPVSR